MRTRERVKGRGRGRAGARLGRRRSCLQWRLAPVAELERLRVVGGEAHEAVLAELDERQRELQAQRRLALAERHAARLAPLDQLARLILCTRREHTHQEYSTSYTPTRTHAGAQLTSQ